MQKNFLILFLLILLPGCVTDVFLAPMNVWRDARYDREAKEGDPEAMYEMGIAHCCGAKPFYDNYTGTKWLCRAARAGHTQAMADIAFWWKEDRGILEQGWGLNEGAYRHDNAVALAWYTVAAEQGHAKAHAEQLELESYIDEDQLERAQTYLRHFPDMPCEIR